MGDDFLKIGDMRQTINNYDTLLSILPVTQIQRKDKRATF